MMKFYFIVLVLFMPFLNGMTKTKNLPVLPPAQTMNPSAIWKNLAQSKKLDRQQKLKIFVDDVEKFQTENEKITPHFPSPQIIRIMTYNVHYWTDPFEQPNFDNILKTIARINPDIVLLQEVSLGKTEFNQRDENEIINRFRKMDYIYGGRNTFCKAASLYGAPFGNMLF